MKIYSGFIFWRAPYFFRVPLFLTAIVTVIYAVVFLILGHVPKIDEIILFNDRDVIYGKIFWNLPEVIHLPWEINSLLEIPIIFAIITSAILIFRFLSRINYNFENNLSYANALGMLIFIDIVIGFCAAAGSTLGNDLAGRDFNGLKTFLEWGGGTALLSSFFFGISLTGAFHSKNGLHQDWVNTYIKLALSSVLFSVTTILLILLMNVGLMTFINSIMLSILGVMLIFNLGMIIGTISGFILKYLSSLRGAKVLSDWLTGQI